YCLLHRPAWPFKKGSGMLLHPPLKFRQDFEQDHGMVMLWVSLTVQYCVVAVRRLFHHSVQPLLNFRGFQFLGIFFPKRLPSLGVVTKPLPQGWRGGNLLFPKIVLQRLLAQAARPETVYQDANAFVVARFIVDAPDRDFHRGSPCSRRFAVMSMGTIHRSYSSAVR